MSEKIEPPLAVPPAPSAGSPGRKPRRRRGFLAKVRVLLLWLVLVLLVAVQAPVFPHVIHGILKLDAWRKGISIQVGAVEGSLFDPVVLRDSVWSYRSETGAITRIEAKRTRAWFAWSNIFPEPFSRWIRSGAEAVGFEPAGKNGIWFQRLEVSGVSAKISLPTDGEDSPEPVSWQWFRSSPGEDWLRAPGTVSIRDADLTLVRGNDWVRADDVRIRLGRIEPGAVHAAQIAWDIHGSAQTFRDVRGRTTLEGSRATFSGLALGPDVRVKSFSAGLADLATGRLSFQAELDAFGGTLATSAETTPRDRQLRVDVNGTFDGIQLAPLGRFIGRNEAAGGVLKKGGFTFRGNPRDFTRAEANVRFDADNFQWDNRQFDRLALGMSLLDQRLHIHEFKLLQGENQLVLSGAMALPQTGVPWWRRQFDFTVNADVRDLTGLAALVLPEFKFVAGQLFVRGAINGTGHAGGKPPTYGGQLILSGGGIKWRSAPLDVLNAALVLHERELQIINAQFLHGDDYLRGVGKISLAGDGAYEGIVRLSARDLAEYQTLLGPPVLPSPPGGRTVIDWQGSGKAAKHEGKFKARLAGVGILGGKGARPTHPLDATIEGRYSGEQMQFDKFELSENGTSLTATVAVGPSAVNLRGIRLSEKGNTILEGDALLPLNLWQRWPDVDFGGLLNEDTVARVNLSAKNLDLRKASLLTGIEWPLAGMVNGTLSVDGALKSLQLGGSLSLQNARIPLNWSGSSVTETGAEFTLASTTVSLTRATGRHASGAFTLEGTLKLADPRVPVLFVTGIGTNTGQPFSFRVEGPATKPVITTDGPAPFAAPKPAPLPAQ